MGDYDDDFDMEKEIDIEAEMEQEQQQEEQEEQEGPMMAEMFGESEDQNESSEARGPREEGVVQVASGGMGSAKKRSMASGDDEPPRANRATVVVQPV